MVVYIEKVIAINGEDIDIMVDSICAQGYNPETVKFVRLIKEELALDKIEIKLLNQFIK